MPGCELDPSKNQEDAEDVKHPGEGADNCRSDRDENTAKNQGDCDADEQDFLLINPRHGKPGHDYEENEEIVDRQTLFGHVTGEELGAVLTPPHPPHAKAKNDG